MPKGIKAEKLIYHTKERDLLNKLANKYKCSPFTGECYTDTVSLQKIKKFYHIILTEEQMNQFGEDFILHNNDAHQFLLMIKPTLEDNNYIFFKRK